MLIYYNYSLILDEDLSPLDPQFWTRTTPVDCDQVRTIGILLCIAAFVGVSLNGALVASFIRYKVLRSSPNIYILFISIMGLLASGTILPLTGTSSVYCRWLYQRQGCQISAAIAFLYGCSSSYLLCVVSLSRCYILVRPFAANRVTVQKSVIISCFVVFLAFIWSILPILGWNEYVIEGARTSCCINWYDRRVSYISFTFFLFFFVYLIPLLIIIVSNTITLINLKEMHDKIEHGHKTVLSRKRIEMEQRIVKSIIITTGGFILTWTPYAITFFISAFQGKDHGISPLITFYCACFAKSSVIWIPLLYISTSTQFRFNFVDINAAKNDRESNLGDRVSSQKLDIVQNADGSIVVRAIDGSQENKKTTPPNTSSVNI